MCVCVCGDRSGHLKNHSVPLFHRLANSRTVALFHHNIIRLFAVLNVSMVPCHIYWYILRRTICVFKSKSLQQAISKSDKPLPLRSSLLYGSQYLVNPSKNHFPSLQSLWIAKKSFLVIWSIGYVRHSLNYHCDQFLTRELCACARASCRYDVGNKRVFFSF